MTEPRGTVAKIWDSHCVMTQDGSDLLFIDRHYLHEGSHHAFARLREAGRTIRHPELTFGVADHYVPSNPARAADVSATMVERLDRNAREFGIDSFGLGDPRRGIVHVAMPEQGLSLPGTTIVCGDSHTATHGAFGAFAFGIGASEVAHVLATQNSVADAGAGDADSRDGTPAKRNHRQGPCAFHHLADRNRRRDWTCR